MEEKKITDVNEKAKTLLTEIEKQREEAKKKDLMFTALS